MNRMSVVSLTAFLLVAGAIPSALGQVVTRLPPPESEKEQLLKTELRTKSATLQTLPVASQSVVAEEVRGIAARLREAQRESDRELAATFLSQADIEAGSTAPKVSINAADLYFKGGHARLYVRSTLPVPAAGSTDGTPSTSATAAGAQPLDDRILSALSDPFGGLMYVAGGTIDRLPGQDADHTRGWFTDLRAGAKFIQLPETLDKDRFRVAPFLIASAGLRLSEPLWFDENGQSEAGRLDASLTLGMNHVVDSTISELFTGTPARPATLDKTVLSLTAAFGLSINKQVALTFSGTAWSSGGLARRFVMGVALLK